MPPEQSAQALVGAQRCKRWVQSQISAELDLEVGRELGSGAERSVQRLKRVHVVGLQRGQCG
jgi:hypothetical protein